MGRSVAALIGLLFLSGALMGQNAQAPNLMSDLNPGSIPAGEFSMRFVGDKVAETTGRKPTAWSANCWDSGASGQLSGQTVDGGPALVLRNLEGRPSAQMYNWKEVPLKESLRYSMSLEYRTAGQGQVSLRGKAIAKLVIPLAATAGQWRTVEIPFSTEEDCGLTVLIQNLAPPGPDNGIALRSLRLLDCGALPSAVPQDGPPPGVLLRESSDLFHRVVQGDLAAAGYLDGRLMIAGSTEDALERISQFVTIDPERRASTKLFDLPADSGVPAKRGRQITAEKTKLEWQTHIQGKSETGIRKGDVIYFTGFIRKIRAVNEWDQAVVNVYYGKEDTRATLRGNGQWKRFHVRLLAGRTYEPGKFNVMFTFGECEQTLELAGLTFVNLGRDAQVDRLPFEKPNLAYAGREPDAPWRREALDRIERIRKADLSVQVLDTAGKPVPGALVRVDMTRHAFAWGTSLASGLLPGQNVKPINDDFKRTAGAAPADKARFQTEVKRLFNCVTALPTWAVWGGLDKRISQNDILAGARWCKENNLPLYSVGVVYPGPEFTPQPWQTRLREAVRQREAGHFDQAFADEFAGAIRGFIQEYANVFGPFGLFSFQIANEFEFRPQYTDALGGDPLDRVTEWFKWAQAANPGIVRQINHTQANQYYFQLVSDLLKRGAPIQRIGIQWHSGLESQSPAARYERLEKFAALGLPLEITEYELTIPDGKSAELRAFQADYTRDMLIACFSHPSVVSFILQDFWQPAAWQANGNSAFFNADWSLNPHGRVYEDLVLGQWWTHASGKTDKSGNYATRAFIGNYDITVTVGEKTYRQTATLDSGGTLVTIKTGSTK